MKKLLLIMFFLPLFLACKKETGVEPLSQLHFINFVDENGENLFKTTQIATQEFEYIMGNDIVTWEALMADKEHKVSGWAGTESDAKLLSGITESNRFLLLEDFQGSRERKIKINGVLHTLTLSPLKEGF